MSDVLTNFFRVVPDRIFVYDAVNPGGSSGGEKRYYGCNIDSPGEELNDAKKDKILALLESLSGAEKLAFSLKLGTGDKVIIKYAADHGSNPALSLAKFRAVCQNVAMAIKGNGDMPCQPSRA